MYYLHLFSDQVPGLNVFSYVTFRAVAAAHGLRWASSTSSASSGGPISSHEPLQEEPT